MAVSFDLYPERVFSFC